MNTWIFVEGATDKALLELLLGDLETLHYQITVAGGRNAARPMARQQLMTRHEPVVLVLDADTTDLQRARSQENDLNDYLAWGAKSIPYKVVQFVPEIEVIFFEDPSVLNSALGADVDPHMQAAGLQAPRRILEILLSGRTRLSLIHSLSGDAVERLRTHPVIADLRLFLAQGDQTAAKRSSG